MRPWLIAVLVGVLWPLAAARAAALDPTVQTELLGLYAHYNAAVSAGNLDQALSLRTTQSRLGLTQYLKTVEDRTRSLAMARSAVPLNFEIKHGAMAHDGTHATILVVATLAVPSDPQSQAPPSGATVRSEVTLAFARESDGWKFDNQSFGMDPDAIKHCPDEAFEPIDAYDRSRNLTAGGPIVRVDFAEDHTLVVFRVLDEETCAFLPSRDTLAKAGFDPKQLVAYAVIQMTGFPHKTDPQKVWIDHLSVTQE